MSFTDLGDEALRESPEGFSKGQDGSAIERVALNSSSLVSAAYNAETESLDIEFVRGPHTYTYYGVPRDVFEGLVSAESAGAFFNANIRNRFASGFGG
jgi:hypothetical protein